MTGPRIVIARNFIEDHSAAMKCFCIRAMFSDGHHGASVSRAFEKETVPTNEEIAAMYEEDAKKELAGRGFPVGGPLKMSYCSVVEIPAMPRLGVKPGQVLKHWKVTVDFVCDDIRYADVAEGVFVWPEEPAGEGLEKITSYLLAKSIASRGDEPDNADYAQVRSRKVAPTDAPAIN